MTNELVSWPEPTVLRRSRHYFATDILSNDSITSVWCQAVWLPQQDPVINTSLSLNCFGSVFTPSLGVMCILEILILLVLKLPSSIIIWLDNTSTDSKSST